MIAAGTRVFGSKREAERTGIQLTGAGGSNRILAYSIPAGGPCDDDDSTVARGRGGDTVLPLHLAVRA
jgi:hypothetical protein